jgi:hypothetical protein
MNQLALFASPALVAAATLVAELGDIANPRQLMGYLGLFRDCAAGGRIELRLGGRLIVVVPGTIWTALMPRSLTWSTRVR